MNLIRKAFTAIRLHWRTLRLQLALLYAGAFLVWAPPCSPSRACSCAAGPSA